MKSQEQAKPMEAIYSQLGQYSQTSCRKETKQQDRWQQKPWTTSMSSPSNIMRLQGARTPVDDNPQVIHASNHQTAHGVHTP